MVVGLVGQGDEGEDLGSPIPIRIKASEPMALGPASTQHPEKKERN